MTPRTHPIESHLQRQGILGIFAILSIFLLIGCSDQGQNGIPDPPAAFSAKGFDSSFYLPHWTRGDSLIALNQPQDALHLYQDYVQNPDLNSDQRIYVENRLCQLLLQSDSENKQRGLRLAEQLLIVPTSGSRPINRVERLITRIFYEEANENYGAIISHCDTALSLINEIFEVQHPDRQYYYWFLALKYYLSDKLETADSLWRLERSLLDTYRFPDRAHLRNYYNFLRVNFYRGNFEQADLYGSSGIEIFQRTGQDSMLAAMCYSLLSSNASAQGNREQFKLYYVEADQIARRIEPTEEYLDYYLINYALGCAWLDMVEEAQLAIDRGVALCADSLPIFEASLYRVQGYLYQKTGAFALAQSFFKQSIALFEQHESTLDHWTIPIFADALMGLAELQIIGDAAKQGITNLNLAAQYDWDRDLKYVAEKMSIDSLAQVDGAEFYLNSYARFFEQRYLLDLPASSPLLDSVLIAHDRLRHLLAYDRQRALETDLIRAFKAQHTYYGGMIAFYHRAYEQTGNLLHLEKAFDLIEQSKAALTFSEVAQTQNFSRFQIPAELQEKLGEILHEERQLIRVRDREESPIMSDSLRLAYRQILARSLELQRELRISFPAFYESCLNPERIGLHDFQSALKRKKAQAICYYMTDSTVFGLWISPDTVQFKRIDWSGEVQQQLVNFLRLLHMPPEKNSLSPGLTSFSAYAENLHRKLLGPFESLLKQDGTLYVIGDKMLQHLPFSLLLHEILSDPLEYYDLPFLINLKDIGYAISATSLHTYLTSDASFVENKVTAWAYGLCRNNSCPETGLPATLKEIELLKKIYGKKVKSYIGKDATAESFFEQASGADFLHLGIHAKADTTGIYGGKFIFRGSNAEVYLSDLSGMSLQAQMVVLSACESGLGKWVPGEGLAHMARPFIAAGTESVVMSLWSLNDATGSEIIGEFYHNISRNQPPETALGQAQRTYLRSASEVEAHPYYWAGLSVVH